MKKNLLWMMAAILFCGAVMTSCNKDDDKISEDATKVKTVEVNYRIKISDATKTSIQKAFTFTIEYYDQTGNLVSVEPLKYGNAEWNNSFNITQFPGKFGVRVTAAPKADLSAIGDGELFDIVYEYDVNGKPSNTDGEYLAVLGKNGTVNYPQLDVKAVAADNEKFVDTFFFTVDANGNIK